MIYFLSGPMTGYPNYNREAFHEAEKRLSSKGDIILSPAYLPEGLSHEHYFWICKAYLDVSDAIYLLKGHRESRGSRLELEYARALRLKILKER